MFLRGDNKKWPSLANVSAVTRPNGKLSVDQFRPFSILPETLDSGSRSILHRETHADVEFMILKRGRWRPLGNRDPIVTGRRGRHAQGQGMLGWNIAHARGGTCEPEIRALAITRTQERLARQESPEKTLSEGDQSRASP